MGSASAEGENRATKAVQKALSSPLLNDNDIKGATQVLLYITYGNVEMTINELSEITNYIQEEAGGTADVIHGHGQDVTLNDKINVVVIATGFDSVVGFEKEPYAQKHTLSEEPKVEIKSPLNSPIETRNERLTQQLFPTQSSTTTHKVTPTSSQSTEATVEIDWEIENTSKPDTPNPNNTTIKRYSLEEDDELDSTNDKKKTIKNNKSTLTPEDQQRKLQERMNRIHELTAKLKRPDGVIQFEKEPAYTRRKIAVDTNTQLSATSQQRSRFVVQENENGVVKLKTNNSFLHDNVD